METRKLDNIYHVLTTTEKVSLFGRISPIHQLTSPPIPLNTGEMHKVSGDIIREAKREVLLAFYKFFANSDGGAEIYQALEELKARAERDKTKINVCMLVNSRGKLAEKFYKPNVPLGIERLTTSDYFNIKVTLHPTVVIGTLHTKLIIIDSEIAMIRGGDPHAANNLSEDQFETAALIKGPIVADMRSDYADVWQAYSKEVLDEICFVEKNAAPLSINQSFIPCMYLSKRENGNILLYTDCEAPYKIALLEAIANAQLSVHILTSNLNDPTICSALAKACERGIVINIITGKYHNDSSEGLWGGTNLDSMANLVRQIDIRHQANLHIRWNTTAHGHIVQHGEPCTLHGKYVCIDNELIFTGSSPLDKQGMYYSREADIIFEDPCTAKLFEDKFFVHKFNQGTDYFDDAYRTLLNTIEFQTQRIEQSATATLQVTKAINLREILNHINDDTHSVREKIYTLLEKVLPVLQLPTGNKPGMPTSYNAVMAVVVKYGLDRHLINQLQNKLSAWKTRVSNHEVSTLLSEFILLKPPKTLQKTLSKSANLVKNISEPLAEKRDTLRKSL